LILQQGMKPKYHELDIDSIESIHRFRQFMKDSYGGIDVLINNAGIAYKVRKTDYVELSYLESLSRIQYL